MPTSFGMVTSRPWMASRMAVSAETSATVIRTRAKSTMRENCRIAEDYSFLVETRLASIGNYDDAPALLFPHIAARMAGPSLLVHRDGNTSVCRPVGDRLIQFLIADIERLAARTLRLLEIPDAFNIQHFGDGLVQDFAGRFRILGANLQLDSAEKIGDELLSSTR